MSKRALIVVDLQPDFLPGGPLAVPDGDAVIEPILALVDSGAYELVVATQDWHPADHGSFAVTISMGIAEFPIDSTSRTELIEKADQALYWSKEHGRNRVTRAASI